MACTYNHALLTLSRAPFPLLRSPVRSVQNSHLPRTLSSLSDPSLALYLRLQHYAHNMFYTVLRKHSLLPSLEIWIFGRIPAVFRISFYESNLRIPGHKGEVRVRALLAYKPGSVGQVAVKDADDPFELVVVSVTSGLDRLWVEEVEPARMR